MDEIIDDFIEKINKFKDEKNIEIEIQFINPFIEISKIFNCDPDVYLELVYKINPQKKIRIRKNFSDFFWYSTTLHDIKQKVNGELWEEKTKLQEKIYDKYDLNISISEEKQTEKRINVDLMNVNMNIYLLYDFKIIYENFILNYRYRYFLGNDRFKSSIYRSLNNKMFINRSPTISFEIEFYTYTKDIKKNLTNLLESIHGVDIKRVLPKNYPFNKNVLKHKTVEEKEPQVTKYFTPKIDGIAHYFILEKNKLILRDLLFNRLPYVFLSDHSSNKKIEGLCEVFLKDEILHFSIFKIMGSSIFDIDKFLKKSKLESNIKCYKKPFLEYNKEEIDAIVNLNEYYGIDIDGVVLLNDNTLEEYKLKKIPTIDVLVDCECGINGFLINEENNSLYFKSVEYDKNNNFSNHFSGELDFFFKKEKFEVFKKELLFKYKGYILPKTFIAEVDVKGNLINIRIDKTNLFLRNKTYTGNSKSVIRKILNKDISLNYEVLNPEVVEEGYFKNSNNSSRGDIHIITNFIKTCYITFFEIHSLNLKRSMVLEIDFGRGGDIYKHFFAHIKKLVATDITEKNREEAIKRYKNTIGSVNAQKGKNRALGYEFIYKIIPILDPNYGSIIGERFDVINWSMALHYSWSKSNISTILENLNKVSKSGTVLNLSFTNGDYLKTRFNSGETKINLKTGTENETMTYSKISEDIVEVSSESFGSKQEFIVSFKDLKEELKKINFVLIDFDNFKNITYTMKKVFKDLEIIEKNESAKNFLKSTKERVNNLKIDNDLLELIIYCSFVKI